MATASTSKPSTSSSGSGKPSGTSGKRVAFVDGTEHGYVGEVHPDKNNDDYTVAGVAGSTAKTSDQPSGSSVDTRAAWAPLRKS